MGHDSWSTNRTSIVLSTSPCSRQSRHPPWGRTPFVCPGVRCGGPLPVRGRGRQAGTPGLSPPWTGSRKCPTSGLGGHGGWDGVFQCRPPRGPPKTAGHGTRYRGDFYLQSPVSVTGVGGVRPPDGPGVTDSGEPTYGTNVGSCQRTLGDVFLPHSVPHSVPHSGPWTGFRESRVRRCRDGWDGRGVLGRTRVVDGEWKCSMRHVR